ncbi:hypothetical protein H1D32_16955 [Anaerobacillus sp. CMMVII]|uniref:hypothetical protein n=1 Tax=Anaerobacillus sp. CMMVII TaxID=2755588 RepID=UPI0021B7C7A2|nr:hypothetical protein [Anaerobacillus sp. CMMVII]MCT8139243.1 hypothetical protein [Anaerobacillus sp. CMMVII]
MQKVTVKLAIAAAVTGLILFVPFGDIKWQFYSVILMVHILLGITLAVFLVGIVTTHVRTELFNPFRQGYKKWNGFKLFLYLFLAIFSGIVMMFFSIPWLTYFHGFIGLWALLVSWKHTK